MHSHITTQQTLQRASGIHAAASQQQSPCQVWLFTCAASWCSVQVLFEAQGRNNKQKAVDLEDMKFHQCVRLARFDNDRTISFIPPDGAFDLMSYRLSQNIK
jgi:hypothetical protein